MKNTFVKLLLLAALVSCLFIFVSCSASLDLTIDEAEDIFEDDDDWTVSVTEYEDGIMKARLSAYNNDTEDRKSFTMIEYIDEDLAKMQLESKELSREHNLKEMKMELESMELSLEQLQTLLEDFKSELEDAEVDAYEEQIDELEEEIKELEKEIDEYDDNYKYGCDGCIFWYGDIEAYELLTGK